MPAMGLKPMAGPTRYPSSKPPAIEPMLKNAEASAGMP